MYIPRSILLQTLLSEQEHPVVKYERLHDTVTQKITDLINEKLALGDDAEEGWCEKRVEALKKFWNERLKAHKNEVKV